VVVYVIADGRRDMESLLARTYWALNDPFLSLVTGSFDAVKYAGPSHQRAAARADRLSKCANNDNPKAEIVSNQGGGNVCLSLESGWA
jgi:hypothetical protein